MACFSLFYEYGIAYGLRASNAGALRTPMHLWQFERFLVPAPRCPLQVIAERDDIKKTFIQLKNDCRAAIKGLGKKKAEKATQALADLQGEFR